MKKNKNYKPYIILSVIFLFEIAMHLSSGGVSVLDDRNILESSAIKHSLITYIATTPFRATSFFVFHTIYRIGGGNPLHYHAANVVLHILVSLLIFFLVKELRGGDEDDPAALIAAGWFALNPVTNAGAFYTSAMPTVLATLFTAATVFEYLRFERTRKGVHLFFTLLFCLMAMFSKENGIAAPIILLALGILSPEKRRLALFYALIFLITAGFFYLRFSFKIDLGSPSDVLSPYQYFLTQMIAIPKYFLDMFLPANLAFEQDVKVRESILDPAVIVCVSGMLAVWLCGVWRFRRSRAVLLFLIWIPITFAPESSIIPLADKMFLHRAYMPALAVAVLLGFAGAWFTRSLDAGLKSRAAVLALVVVLCLSVINVKAARSWVSDVKVYQYSVRVSPDKWRVRNNLANVLLKQRRIFETRVQIETAMKLKPNDGDVNNNMGLYLYYQGNIADAVKYYLKAIEYKQTNSEAYSNLAFAYVQLKDFDKAIEYFKKGLQYEPDNAPAHYNLGMAYLMKNDPDSAIRELRAALEINPDYELANESLRHVLEMKERR